MPVHHHFRIPCLVLMLALGGCELDRSLAAPPAANLVPVTIDLVRPRAADWYASHTATSPLEAVAAASVRAKIGGEVLEIYVEEGDAVDKGQPLARLDGQRSRLALQQVGAELAQSVNALARARTLAERGLVSRASVESLEFAVAELTAAQQLRKLELDYAVIRAPIAGTVAARTIRVGQQLKDNEPTFQVTDTTRLVAELRIPQAELQQFAPGQPVTVRPDALPELSVAAMVDRISPTIDPLTGTFGLTVYVDNTAGQLAPGMFSRVTIGYQKHENAMILPASAIRQEDGAHVVYVVRDDGTERRSVTTGIWQNRQVEIVSGLAFDEQVFRNAADGLIHGDRVLATNVMTAASGGD